jgi:hypothetical protein
VVVESGRRLVGEQAEGSSWLQSGRDHVRWFRKRRSSAGHCNRRRGERQARSWGPGAGLAVCGRGLSSLAPSPAAVGGRVRCGEGDFPSNDKATLTPNPSPNEDAGRGEPATRPDSRRTSPRTSKNRPPPVNPSLQQTVVFPDRGQLIPFWETHDDARGRV